MPVGGADDVLADRARSRRARARRRRRGRRASRPSAPGSRRGARPSALDPAPREPSRPRSRGVGRSRSLKSAERRDAVVGRPSARRPRRCRRCGRAGTRSSPRAASARAGPGSTARRCGWSSRGGLRARRHRRSTLAPRAHASERRKRPRRSVSAHAAQTRRRRMLAAAYAGSMRRAASESARRATARPRGCRRPCPMHRGKISGKLLVGARR